MEPSESQPETTRAARFWCRPFSWTARRTAVSITAGIGAAAAILSYEHALAVTQLLGNSGWETYLVPLLPDGLIGAGSAALYQAAQAGARRAWQAASAVITGILVTVTLNVASGLYHEGHPTRWMVFGRPALNALAPVALLLAIGVLERMFRRDAQPAAAAGPETALAPPGPAGDRPPREWLDDWIRLLRGRMTERGAAAALGISRSRVRAVPDLAVAGGGAGD